jgi:hypothetical protein
MIKSEEAERIMILVSAHVHLARKNEKKWPFGVGMPKDESTKEIESWLDIEEYVYSFVKD